MAALTAAQSLPFASLLALLAPRPRPSSWPVCIFRVRCGLGRWGLGPAVARIFQRRALGRGLPPLAVAVLTCTCLTGCATTGGVPMPHRSRRVVPRFRVKALRQNPASRRRSALLAVPHLRRGPLQGAPTPTAALAGLARPGLPAWRAQISPGPAHLAGAKLLRDPRALLAPPPRLGVCLRPSPSAYVIRCRTSGAATKRQLRRGPAMTLR